MIIQMIHATFAPVFGTLGRPGRDVEHNEFELEAARVKIGFATILRSPVLLLLYLGYLIPLASHSSTSSMPSIFNTDTWTFLLFSGRERQQWLLE